MLRGHCKSSRGCCCSSSYTYTASINGQYAPKKQRFQLANAAASANGRPGAEYRGPESFPQPSAASSGHGLDGAGSNGSSSDGGGGGGGRVAEVMKLVALLPPRVRARLDADPQLPELVEVVMDLGRPPLARFPAGDVRLAESPVDHADLQVAVALCGEFGGDNRAGINQTLHRISCIRNRAGRVVGLTCRVGRAVQGSAAMVADLAIAGKSILLLGRPGVGKTTAIREICRLLATDHQRRVVIVDTSNEIGGDGDVPHGGVGRARRMQVPHPEQQHKVMIEAVENHMPEVIVIDEIGTEAEALAARTIAQRGVQLVATAHGNELENVMKNPSLNDLVGGIASVTLGDDEAKRRGGQKSVLERRSPPTFDAAVEMVGRDQWRVHLDVASAVDALLLGREAGAEVRQRDGEGRVWAWPEDKATDADESDSEEWAGDTNAAAAGVAAAGGNAAGGRRQLLKVETQPFPKAALNAARKGSAAVAAKADVVKPTRSTKSGSTSSSDSGGKGAAVVPASPPLQVYLYGVDVDSVRSVVEALDMEASLAIADAVQDADAVLATRPKLRASGWIRGAAAAARVPIYSVRSASVEHVVKAVRTLLGVDPSPGGVFAATDSEAPAGADPRVASSRTMRAETSIALVNKAAGRRAAGAYAAGSERSALEEARLAIESIVLKQGQPAELMAREARVVELQAALVQQYGLACEVAGSPAAGGVRLRVMPAGWQPEGQQPETAPAVAAAAAVKGAVKKQFW